MLQCIGNKAIREHADERPALVRCKNTSETPNNPKWPDVYLCPDCANAPAKGASPATPAENLIAMQTDPEEYKGQMELGFMSGLNRDAEGEEGE